jgi:hypothetical protein
MQDHYNTVGKENQMKKSEVYRTAIAVVIDNENLDMEIKIEVMQELFERLDSAEHTEKWEAQRGKA